MKQMMDLPSNMDSKTIIQLVLYLYFIFDSAYSQSHYLANGGNNLLNTFESTQITTHNKTVPAPEIDSSCKAFVDEYAVVTAGFTQCSIMNARPLRFCEMCVVYYVMAKSIYQTIIKGEAKDERGNLCGQYILNADKMQLISQTEHFIEKVWSDGSCENCFKYAKRVNDSVEFSLKENVKHFYSQASSTWQCFLDNSEASIRPFGPSNFSENNTVCHNCKALYKDVNSYYVHLEEEYAHKVCIDVVDMMNYTRMLWSGDFKCTRPKGDIKVVLVPSIVFCITLPVVFYVAAKIYGTKQELKIIQQKRFGLSSESEPSTAPRL